MRSYRQRVAVQMQHRTKSKKSEVIRKTTKTRYLEVREYLIRAISMYRAVSERFEPLSDEWAMCKDFLFKYKMDLEILEKGSYEERKGVIEKYGR